MAATSIGNPQSNNLYAYTQNMPTDFTDPSGLNASAGFVVCYDIVTYGHWSNDPSSSVVHTETVCFTVGGGQDDQCDKRIAGYLKYSFMKLSRVIPA